MFDFDVDAVPNADGSLTGRCQITKDGNPFVVYTATYSNLSAAEAQELQQFVDGVMSRVQHKGLKSIGEVHALQRKLVNRLLEFGDVKGHGKA